MLRLLCLCVFSLILSAPLSAQDADPVDRRATGGAQTLQDILKRQEGLKVDDSFRRGVTGYPDNAAAATDQLGTLGGASDPDLWRAYRYNFATITTQARGPAADVLIQDGGMRWLQFRQGPLLKYGTGLVGGIVVLLVLFYLIRGRIRIDGEKTGRTILRFNSVERFAHWLLAGSFLVLGFTGLITLAGRKFLIPAFGHDAFAALAVTSKWIHNNVSWGFMLALILIFVFWVIHNLPDRTDINWLLRGGGIFGGGHPPAKKFNAGQKMIFWSVIVLGGSISVSGLSLLFPFELPMFAATFEMLNAVGLPQLLGFGELTTALAPHEEMQYAQLWHAGISFVLMSIVIAHIYIGSVGMEGAYDAMGKGEVELQWAREHHSIWTAEAEEKKSQAGGST